MGANIIVDGKTVINYVQCNALLTHEGVATAYDFDDARLVVIARERREGESINIDVSKAYYNQNPKYPQAWYDINKKTNPYAEDSRW